MLITKHVVATAEFSVDMIIINISLVCLVKTEPNLVIVIQSPMQSNRVDFCPDEQIECTLAARPCHCCPALVLVLILLPSCLPRNPHMLIVVSC